MRKYLNHHYNTICLHIKWCKFLNDALFIRIGQILISFRSLASIIVKPLLGGEFKTYVLLPTPTFFTLSYSTHPQVENNRNVPETQSTNIRPVHYAEDHCLE